MSSIIRPSAAQMTRRLIVLAAALFAVIIPYAQMALHLGQSQAAFAAQGDQTLRVAGFAFSIWALIYLGLLAYAIRQALPQTGESELLRWLGWPSVVAFLGIGGWIIAAAMDWRMATDILIIAAALALLIPLAAGAARVRALPRGDRDLWLTAWPLSLLAGWLTIAAPVNILTVATADGALPTALSPTAWGILAIVVAGVIALVMTLRLRIMAFALPVAWGALGVFVAEQERNPVLGFSALAAGLIVLIGALIIVFQLRRSIEKA